MPNRIKTELLEAIAQLGALAEVLRAIALLANEGAENPEKAEECCKQIIQLLHELIYC